MKVGVDLDGIISRAGLYNPSLRLPSWLFIFLVPLVLLMTPNKRVIAGLKEIENSGHQIIIISARPSWMTELSERWLKRHGVPYNEIFCVGFGKGTKLRKLETIKREKIELFFDDNDRIVEFLNQNFIGATTNFL